jgi:hypothetical protein
MVGRALVAQAPSHLEALRLLARLIRSGAHAPADLRFVVGNFVATDGDFLVARDNLESGNTMAATSVLVDDVLDPDRTDIAPPS